MLFALQSALNGCVKSYKNVLFVQGGGRGGVIWGGRHPAWQSSHVQNVGSM